MGTVAGGDEVRRVARPAGRSRPRFPKRCLHLPTPQAERFLSALMKKPSTAGRHGNGAASKTLKPPMTALPPSKGCSPLGDTASENRLSFPQQRARRLQRSAIAAEQSRFMSTLSQGRTLWDPPYLYRNRDRPPVQFEPSVRLRDDFAPL